MHNELDYQSKEILITGASLLAGAIGGVALAKVAKHFELLKPVAPLIGFAAGLVSFKATGDFLDAQLSGTELAQPDNFSYPPRRGMEM